jgi:hypothetical protein
VVVSQIFAAIATLRTSLPGSAFNSFSIRPHAASPS